MTFEVPAAAYGRFMGRFSEPLARLFADSLDLAPGQRALDVGAGPGALTAVLAEELGAGAVSAVDPSAMFVDALRERLPDIEVRQGAAESLPWPDATFDRTTAQLVVHFMTDPLAGLTEMARVTRPGGLVAANAWDFSDGFGPLGPFWTGVHRVIPSAPSEQALAGTVEGQLADFLAQAGLRDIAPTALTVRVDFTSFEDWWEPFTFGVGPAGGYLTSLDDEQRTAIRTACAGLLPDGPFALSARAWSATGRV